MFQDGEFPATAVANSACLMRFERSSPRRRPGPCRAQRFIARFGESAGFPMGSEMDGVILAPGSLFAFEESAHVGL
jgi:hypothetical protein